MTSPGRSQDLGTAVLEEPENGCRINEPPLKVELQSAGVVPILSIIRRRSRGTHKTSRERKGFAGNLTLGSIADPSVTGGLNPPPPADVSPLDRVRSGLNEGNELRQRGGTHRGGDRPLNAIPADDWGGGLDGGPEPSALQQAPCPPGRHGGKFDAMGNNLVAHESVNDP